MCGYLDLGFGLLATGYRRYSPTVLTAKHTVLMTEVVDSLRDADEKSDDRHGNVLIPSAGAGRDSLCSTPGGYPPDG
jgi:hypothetical protein